MALAADGGLEAMNSAETNPKEWELGMRPVQGLQNIGVINGKPVLYGDAVAAVCRQSPDWEYVKETFIEDYNGEGWAYECRLKRKGEPEHVQVFSKKDAERAKLWGKSGPWTDYPKRMLKFKASGYAYRDVYPDMLKGTISEHEAMDYPEPKDVSPKKQEPKPSPAQKPYQKKENIIDVKADGPEDIERKQKEIENIYEVLEGCTDVSTLKKMMIQFGDGFDSAEMKKLVIQIGTEIHDRKFKEVKSGN